MNLKYWLGALISIPLLPVLYVQGEMIKARVPILPEAAEPQGLTFKKDRPLLKLISIGESTIAGVGVDTHDEGFTGTLAQHLSEKYHASVSWRVYAQNGYNAGDVHKQLLPRITEPEVDLIVIGLGGNDAFELNTPWRWKRNIRKVIATLQAKFPDTPIVFNNMPPIRIFPAFTGLIQFIMGNLVEMFGEELARIVTEYDQVYYHGTVINFESWSKIEDIEPEPTLFFSDGVHPSKLAYQIWAKDIANFIEKLSVVTLLKAD